jgi:hypothetical protein
VDFFQSAALPTELPGLREKRDYSIVKMASMKLVGSTNQQTLAFIALTHKRPVDKVLLYLFGNNYHGHHLNHQGTSHHP